MLVKIYNEKDQAEEKRSNRKLNEGKYCDQRDKQIKKWTKGNGDLRARSHPDKFPICGKELKKSLESSVIVLAFNPSPQKADWWISEFKASLVYRASYRTAKFSQ